MRALIFSKIVSNKKWLLLYAYVKFHPIILRGLPTSDAKKKAIISCIFFIGLY